ncbi:MAG: hypothetical protein ACRDNM_04165, partial [Gaiellaceae bacterium]
MNTSTFGAPSSPPANVFPPPPAGSQWQPRAQSALPAGLQFPTPIAVFSNANDIFARALVPLADGSAFLLLRDYPRSSNFRTRNDFFYFAAAPRAAAPRAPGQLG